VLDSRATFCPNCGATIPDPLLGTSVAGKYYVERRIAIGGFGSIYRGTETSGRAIALKVMHRELADDASLVERFRREGRVLGSLRDRHTVATYEMGQTASGLPYIAMELLDGDTLLATTRAANRLPWARMFAIARGVCSALAEAHGLGVIHRDLKPANIFVVRGDVAKVLDFGIAKILSNSEMSDPNELTRMGTAVGSVDYMAPEQLMGGRAEPRSDLYTLGVVMYEAITGRRPYSAAGLALLTEQLSGPPQPPSALVDVTPEVDAIVMKCLAADVDDRYASAAELAAALDDAIAHFRPVPPPPLPIPPAPAPMRPQPVRRRSRGVLVAVILGLVIVAGGLIGAFIV
jgi:serine/threonine-protein kinase